MHIPLLADILVIFALAVAVVLLFSRLRIPAIVGLLLTGVIAGPGVFAAIRGTSDVEVFAEIGVILLMFTIGLEFSLRDLARIGPAVLLGGTAQAGVTVAVTTAVAMAAGTDAATGVFYGFLVALSSTAVVLKVYQDRAERDTPHGRAALGVLIFQDIAVVPMMLLIPVLAGSGGGNGGWELLRVAGTGAALVVAVLIAARTVVPWLLYQIARTRSSELFLLSVVLLCFAVAWSTSELGLSLALGAFLAGLVISESEYSQHALGSVLPFKDVFTSFFFISIGLLFDPAVVASHPVLVLALTAGVIVVKALVATGAVLLLRLPARVAVLAGIGLAQVGEFSFILAKIGARAGLLDGAQSQLFLAVSILSLAATPLLMAVAPRLAAAVSGRTRDREPDPDAHASLRDHLIVIGYGINGRNLTRAARTAGIPYAVIEMNARTVREERKRGEPLHFGDASRDAVLRHVGVERARTAVIAISDAAATRRIVERARALNPHLHIIARTRYTQEVAALQSLGADEVIPEEFETSVEIFTRVLRRYLVPESDIDAFAADVRAGAYEMFRRPAAQGASGSAHLPELDIVSFRVHGSAEVAGRTLLACDLRRRLGITVVAIRRGEALIPNPSGDERLQTGDIAVVIATPERLVAARPLFEGSDDEQPDSRGAA